MIYDVAIIGGGVAGAATAVGFTVSRAHVVLFERRDLARDPNRGDVIHPHAREVLRSWGALEALHERGAFDARRLMLTDATGFLRARFRTFRRPALMLNHAEIELSLLGVYTWHPSPQRGSTGCAPRSWRVGNRNGQRTADTGTPPRRCRWRRLTRPSGSRHRGVAKRVRARDCRAARRPAAVAAARRALAQHAPRGPVPLLAHHPGGPLPRDHCRARQGSRTLEIRRRARAAPLAR